MQKFLPGMVPTSLADLVNAVEGISHGMVFLQYFAEKAAGEIKVEDSSHYNHWGAGEEDYDRIPTKTASAMLGPDGKHPLRLHICIKDRWAQLEIVLQDNHNPYRYDYTALIINARGSVWIESNFPDYRTYRNGKIHFPDGFIERVVQMHRELSDLCGWE